MGVRGFLALAMVCATTAAQGASYTFYQGQNNVPATITLEHHRTPFEACKGTVGLLYSTSLSVAAATFAPGSGACTAVLDDGTAATVTIATDSSSCPDDIAFDFERQTCEVFEGQSQLFAVVVAAFFWLCLIGGLSVGYRFGS